MTGLRTQENVGVGRRPDPIFTPARRMSYPGVDQVAVFGIPDPLYGERVRAIIVRVRGSDLEVADLTSYCQHHLAPFEVPERVTFADQLPLTAKGSLDRTKLSDYLLTGKRSSG